MKTFLLLFSIAFCIFQLKAESDPEAGLEDVAGEAKKAVQPRTPIQCGSVGGYCYRSHSCRSNEFSVGECFPGVLCCKKY